MPSAKRLLLLGDSPISDNATNKKRLEEKYKKGRAGLRVRKPNERASHVTPA